MREQAEGEPRGGGQQQPEAPRPQEAAHEGDRPHGRDGGGEQAEQDDPDRRRGQPERRLHERIRRLAHDDDLERTPAYELHHIDDGGQDGATRPEAGPQHGHGGKPGIRADDPGERQQHHADDGAHQNGGECGGKAEAGRDERARLEHQKADAEAEPQRKRIARHEHPPLGADGNQRIIGGRGRVHGQGSRRAATKSGNTSL